MEFSIFNAVPKSSMEYYSQANLTMELINLCLSYSTLFSSPFILLTIFLDSKFHNLRLITLLSSWSLLLSDLVRMLPTWIPSLLPNAFVIMVIGQVLNQIGGSFAYPTPSLVSATWFSAKERAIITAIGTESNYLGVAVGFLVYPLLITKGSDIPVVLLYLLIAQAICTLSLTVYFPARPPTPPSFSEALKHEELEKNRKESSASSHNLSAPTPASALPSATAASPTASSSSSSSSLLDSPPALPLPSSQLAFTETAKPSFYLTKVKPIIRVLCKPAIVLLIVAISLESAAAQAFADNVTYFYTVLDFSEFQGGIFAFVNSIASVAGTFCASFVAERLHRKHKWILMAIFILTDLSYVFFLFALPLPKFEPSSAFALSSQRKMGFNFVFQKHMPHTLSLLSSNMRAASSFTSSPHQLESSFISSSSSSSSSLSSSCYSTFSSSSTSLPVNPPLRSFPYWLFSLFIVFQGFAAGSPNGICFELGAEMTYPFSEAISGSTTMVLMQLLYTFILFVFSKTEIGWMAIVTLVASVLSTGCVVFMKVIYPRDILEKEAGKRAKEKEELSNAQFLSSQSSSHSSLGNSMPVEDKSNITGIDMDSSKYDDKIPLLGEEKPKYGN
eukprot:MONOS_9752.1-p1 / transcript=MONOS_9752.1 / gene=MONOS_9752 / organism=Monocercomonoides_exilis_PA203 / gene_product=unspecified product / transcript_product=unspecified product / location=Mono_scaffold00415:22515-24419(-) / protein_length=616 / sequence_SO=supercontig / SO=protein_coding / is_pseudo=false